MAKILLVDDDTELTAVLGEWLESEGYIVESAENGEEALSRLSHYEYDVVVMDVGLPDMEGFKVCAMYRSRGGTLPVIMLTGRGQIADKTQGFESGADDYLTKPFHGKELMARVQALLRRPANLSVNHLSVGRLELIPERRSIKRDGEEISLVNREYSLLEFLLKHPEELFPAERLLNQVWSEDGAEGVGTEALSSCIKRLRKKLDVNDRESFIKNVYGVGYGIFPKD